MQSIKLNGNDLKPQQVAAIASGEITHMEIDEAALQRVSRNHAAFREAANRSSRPIYGTGTDTGARKHIRMNGNIDPRKIIAINATTSSKFPDLEPGVSKAMLAIQINSMLAGGIGAVRPELVRKLGNVFNGNALEEFPKIKAIGLGDGDLIAGASFAHWWLEKPENETFNPEPGEVLALIAGNYYSDALSVVMASRLDKLMDKAYLAYAVSCEAFRAQTQAISPAIARMRPLPELLNAIRYGRKYLEGGRLLDGPSRNLQDSICFRNFPQIAATVEDALKKLNAYLGIEINASTQNPLYSETSDEIIHNANFDTSYHSNVLGALQKAVIKYAGISNKRFSQLGDPAFNGGAPSGYGDPVTPASGLHARNLGYLNGHALTMVAQYGQSSVMNNLAVTSEDGIENDVSGVFQQSLNAEKMVDFLETVIDCELIAGIAGLQYRIREEKSVSKADLAPAVAKVYAALSTRIDISGKSGEAWEIERLCDGLYKSKLIPMRRGGNTTLSLPVDTMPQSEIDKEAVRLRKDRPGVFLDEADYGQVTTVEKGQRVGSTDIHFHDGNDKMPRGR